MLRTEPDVRLSQPSPRASCDNPSRPDRDRPTRGEKAWPIRIATFPPSCFAVLVARVLRVFGFAGWLLPQVPLVGFLGFPLRSGFSDRADGLGRSVQQTQHGILDVIFSTRSGFYRANILILSCALWGRAVCGGAPGGCQSLQTCFYIHSPAYTPANNLFPYSAPAHIQPITCFLSSLPLFSRICVMPVELCFIGRLRLILQPITCFHILLRLIFSQ